MTMFEQLYALATHATLTMIVSADEQTGRLTVNVIPKPRKDADEPALAQPLSLTATPQEFDAGFIDALSGYRETRLNLAQQAEATKAVLEAARAASVKKASQAAAKANTAKTTVAAKPAAGNATGADDEQKNSAPVEAATATPDQANSNCYDLFG
jgi:PRTRC genetic system protein E